MSQKTNPIILIFIALIATSIVSCTLPPWWLPAPANETKHQALSLEVRVHASEPWLDTEVLIQPGDILMIQYVFGSWGPWSAEGYDGIGSGGDPNCSCNVIMGVSHAALIGKIGDGDPFFVGNQFRQPMGASGYLQLGINDTRLNDNSGSLLVLITLSQ